jgi:hypothetical protein
MRIHARYTGAFSLEQPFVSISALNQPQNWRPRVASVLLLLSATWLGASQSHAAAKGTWSADAERDQTFSRVLIVGVSPDLNQRCRFERAMATRIRSEHTEAFVSCDVMPPRTQLSRESIEAAVAEKDADAVFATSLVSKTWEVNDKGTNDTRGDAYYKATDAYYGIYGGTVIATDFRTTAPVMNVKGQAQVTSELYETHGATVVYTVETKVRNIESTGDGLAAVADPIGKRLRKDKLIR